MSLVKFVLPAQKHCTVLHGCICSMHPLVMPVLILIVIGCQHRQVYASLAACHCMLQCVILVIVDLANKFSLTLSAAPGYQFLRRHLCSRGLYVVASSFIYTGCPYICGIISRDVLTCVLYIRMISGRNSLTGTRKSRLLALQEAEQRKCTQHALSENMHLLTTHYERWKNCSLSTDQNHNSLFTVAQVISVQKLQQGFRMCGTTPESVF